MSGKCDISQLAGAPVAIGSLPHTDPEAAVDVALKYLPELPFLPELPRHSYLEHMGNNQSEGVPGASVDDVTHRLVVKSGGDLGEAVEAFYQAYLADDVDAFSIGPDHAAGLHAMLARLASANAGYLCVKGQLTGPTTFGLVAKDEQGRAMLYDETFMDILVKATAMKARWLQMQLSKLGAQAIIFFDEPMLQSIGSPTVPIDAAKAVEYLNEVSQPVQCLTGCHCCGNTDWSILMGSNIDIIAFDAFHFGETMTLYPHELRAFLGRGGMLAWGIVPSTQEVESLDAQSLVQRLDGMMRLVADQGVSMEQLHRQALITTSCGLGSLSESTAERALSLLADVSGLVRGRQAT